MTAAEKQTTANFLDLANDYLFSGYRRPPNEYHFEDSAGEEEPLPVCYDNESIEKIALEIKACFNCQLGKTRINAVPGEGVLQPLVMTIGEGPGADEDAQGRPFVGKAGQQLDKMLASINLSRNTNCFIANVVKCRPPNNREPYPEEAAACAHFLERQIAILKPKFILAAGRVAAQALLKTTDSISKMRGRFIDLTIGNLTTSILTIPLIVTYHPSAILRNPDLRAPAWEDLKLLRSKLPELLN